MSDVCAILGSIYLSHAAQMGEIKLKLTTNLHIHVSCKLNLPRTTKLVPPPRFKKNAGPVRSTFPYKYIAFFFPLLNPSSFPSKTNIYAVLKQLMVTVYP